MSGNETPGTKEPPGLECAICFNDIAQSTALPCSCRVAYCGRCWDRALAGSFNACGQARCPSCRGPVRVDFDPEAAGGRGRLVFSRESEDLTFLHELEVLGPDSTEQDAEEAAQGARLQGHERAMAVAEAREATVQRLAEQAVPAQRRLLERYGSEQGRLREVAHNAQRALDVWSVAGLKRLLRKLGGSPAGVLEKADLLERLLEKAGSAAVLASSWAGMVAAAGEAPAPECVCGGALLRVGGLDRERAYLLNSRPGLSPTSSVFEALVEDITRDGIHRVICDLCETNRLTLDSAVWTCGRGDDTILHAKAYDVCEDCFLRHAFGIHRTAPAPMEEEVPQ